MALEIMIVDDSVVMLKNLTAMVESLGHKVVATCSSGQAAAEMYEKVNPDIVTMDIMMPNIDGIETAKMILSVFNTAKIIMVTSVGQEVKVLEALKAGVKGYVLKPVKADKLKEAIDKIAPLCYKGEKSDSTEIRITKIDE